MPIPCKKDGKYAKYLLQNLSNNGVEISVLTKNFLDLPRHLPHSIDLSSIAALNTDNLHNNIAIIIQKISDSDKGKNWLITLNTIAKLLKLNIINTTTLSKDTIELIRKLAINAMNKLYIIKMKPFNLHEQNHQLRQFIADMSHIADLYSSDSSNKLFNAMINTISYYFNAQLKNEELNKIKIKNYLITCGSLGHALELITKIIKLHSERRNAFFEKTVIEWVKNLNIKWNYNNQDLSYVILNICQIINRNLFSSNAEEILIKYLDKFISDVFNKKKEDDFKSSSPSNITYSNVLEGISLIRERYPKYLDIKIPGDKEGKIISSKLRMDACSPVFLDTPLKAIETSKTINTEIQQDKHFNKENSTSDTIKIFSSKLTFFGEYSSIEKQNNITIPNFSKRLQTFVVLSEGLNISSYNSSDKDYVENRALSKI